MSLLTMSAPIVSWYILDHCNSLIEEANDLISAFHCKRRFDTTRRQEICCWMCTTTRRYLSHSLSRDIWRAQKKLATRYRANGRAMSTLQLRLSSTHWGWKPYSTSQSYPNLTHGQC